MGAGSGVRVTADGYGLGTPYIVGRDIHVPVLHAEVSSYYWSFDMGRCGEVVYPDWRRHCEVDDVDSARADIDGLGYEPELDFTIGGGFVHTVLSHGCAIALDGKDSFSPSVTVWDSESVEDAYFDRAEFRPSDAFVDAYNEAWEDWDEIDSAEAWADLFDQYSTRTDIYDEHGMRRPVPSSNAKHLKTGKTETKTAKRSVSGAKASKKKPARKQTKKVASSNRKPVSRSKKKASR